MNNFFSLHTNQTVGSSKPTGQGFSAASSQARTQSHVQQQRQSATTGMNKKVAGNAITNNHMGSGIVKYQTTTTALHTTFNSEIGTVTTSNAGKSGSEPQQLY